MGTSSKRHRLEQHDEAERRRKRMVMGFSFFMIFLMVFSVASVINYSPESGSQMRYGNYEFVLESRADGGSVLTTPIEGREVEFQNLPTQVAYLSFDPQAVPLLRNAQQIALSADPGLDIQSAAVVSYAQLQLGIAIPKTFPALTHPDPVYSLPSLNCSQASLQVPVVLFNLTNETAKATVTGACVILHGEGPDVTRLKDRLIFEYYDILRDGQVVES